MNTDIRDKNLDLPNIYYVTVFHAGVAHSTHIAADFNGAALSKVQRWCEEVHGFRPVRANSDTKMRRMKLGDYLECPEAIGVAQVNADMMNEVGTVKAMERRRAEVDQMLALVQGQGGCVRSDFAEVERMLAEALSVA